MSRNCTEASKSREFSSANAAVIGCPRTFVAAKRNRIITENSKRERAQVIALCVVLYMLCHFLFCFTVVQRSLTLCRPCAQSCPPTKRIFRPGHLLTAMKIVWGNTKVWTCRRHVPTVSSLRRDTAPPCPTGLKGGSVRVEYRFVQYGMNNDEQGRYRSESSKCRKR